MPARPPWRGRSSTKPPLRVSCRRMVRTAHQSTQRAGFAAFWRPPRRVRSRAMPGGRASHASRLAEVESAFRTLPERYLGAPEGFDATYHVRLGDVGHTWEVRCTAHGARVRKGGTSRRPDVVIGTDATTWLRLRSGAVSGIEAFSS